MFGVADHSGPVHTQTSNVITRTLVEIVRRFLNCPPYSREICHLVILIYGPFIEHLRGIKFVNNEGVETGPEIAA